MKAAFSLVPEYLRTPEESVAPNLMDYGVSLGRRFRALKLWMVIRAFGQEGLAARIREHVRLAQVFRGWVEQDPAFEVVAPSAAFGRVLPRRGDPSIPGGRRPGQREDP